MEKILSLATLRARRSELNKQADELRRQLAAVLGEQAEIEKAEELVAKFGQLGPSDAARTRQPAFELDDNVPPPAPRMPLREIVIAALNQITEVWADANQIQAVASTIRGSEVPMGSISPTLTVLKNDGLIVRDGMKVALKERAEALMDEIEEVLRN